MSDEDWIVFTREADPAGFIISVNQAISSGGTSLVAQDCYEMKFEFTPLQIVESGMPDKDTQVLYHAVEDRVTDAIEPAGGQIVAKRTGQSSRSIWLCGPKTILPAVQAAIGAMTDFRIVIRPSSLSEIKVLHPTLLEAQLARNEQLLNHMKQQGDDGSARRKTNHFIYGVTPANRSLIEARLQTLGFQLDPNRPDIDPEAFVFFRFSPLDPQALNNDVRALSTLCAEFGCDYDGWDTDFVKSPQK
jgi:hypothetical protein